MEWSKALEKMEQGDIIHLPNGINYIFLYKSNHFLIYVKKLNLFYCVKPGDKITSKNNWEVDNSVKEKINTQLKYLEWQK